MAKFTALVLLLSLALAASPVSAWAEDDAPITVNVNMARVLRINSPAATVIVGNPGIADVTIQDPQTLVLTGKSFGQTNLIVLDGNGNPVADTLIDVVQLQAGTMTVYQGAARTSLACAPVCQPTIMLGDENTFTSTQVDSANMIKSTAGQ
ncbi:MAG: pilus assembly protein [Devosia sp.]|uniref:pilus assembly protein N-terminal domain-containing protein n=1 Tax=Devosia sp. TaxID=1871048 RepID=UPI002626E111|nr:pilus assembly protein N-terminal domain-containing protein [Devosia sp.]MDB5589048.1 pilus assembly protein [Devosia sp.]